MTRILEWINTYIFGPSLPIVIFGAGIVFLIHYRFFIFTHPMKILSVFTRKSDENGVSPLRSVMLALASTLGVGNIVGVSTAIAAGGAGAIFWMTLSAFVAMPVKYSEIVLAMKTRFTEKQEKTGKEEYRGGTMYYLKEKTGSRHLGVFFALLCILNALCVGNIVQINAVAESCQNVLGLKPFILGIIAALAVFVCISGGTKKVIDITSSVIPFVTILYIGISVVVIVMNGSRIPGVLKLIFDSAFNIRSVAGGVGGYAIVRAMRYGVARGIMSNEAGSGTSPTAHVKSNLKNEAEQGFWGIFEVFADTVVMCNLTALVILLSYEKLVIGEQLTGMELVLRAYSEHLGRTSDYIIVLSVLLFAFATIVCQGFYGTESVYFITKKQAGMKIYRLVFSMTVVFGSVCHSSFIWSLTDFTVSLMTVINTACLCLFCSEIKTITDNYFKATGKSKEPRRSLQARRS